MSKEIQGSKNWLPKNEIIQLNSACLDSSKRKQTEIFKKRISCNQILKHNLSKEKRSKKCNKCLNVLSK
ncbi:hypothetical protein GLOIN_2v1490048 [Rhizophagus irregularis DAOM 181602=DAOM 197198]|uniref:Uncharacterized protein n=1 Tax=Rhizophagus irregularis (strain DAOM 181602 / DAOM 197198 / MUCL 43194) TaxID=747089 RepID=A0A2P4QZU8_RHIID|nr:hypothetical protein GLOIN_2v1490048 [Rhizophagus irregularis DAOM 181602=DAOM 197198]POG83180.1 hypothetical protein GLOIN_2v1490048 [Rhizophagus irregularis DAOM 181602=DAOM 197198]GET55117.1 hypothetical protein GLOIN_2v1490048 [Rhizophagus irregularis DAOM 181602=DAOM 197198]|eukprot:XP_025190046.1 hypothetical protein GLOIN_2v1490048 [Rhizophagus irregularis DAOM 181602=DAOM 197198]